jgi:hypothetical protein
MLIRETSGGLVGSKVVVGFDASETVEVVHQAVAASASSASSHSCAAAVHLDKPVWAVVHPTKHCK